MSRKIMHRWDSRAIAFGLACLAYGLSGCSATALSAADPAARSADRWGDLSDESQLCERLGGVGCAACAEQPDAAACYRQSYRSAAQWISARAPNPFDDDDDDDDTPAVDNAELAREGMAVSAIGEVIEAVRQ